MCPKPAEKKLPGGTSSHVELMFFPHSSSLLLVVYNSLILNRLRNTAVVIVYFNINVKNKKKTEYI